MEKVLICRAHGSVQLMFFVDDKLGFAFLVFGFEIHGRVLVVSRGTLID